MQHGPDSGGNGPLGKLDLPDVLLKKLHPFRQNRIFFQKAGFIQPSALQQAADGIHHAASADPFCRSASDHAGFQTAVLPFHTADGPFLSRHSAA